MSFECFHLVFLPRSLVPSSDHIVSRLLASSHRSELMVMFDFVGRHHLQHRASHNGGAPSFEAFYLACTLPASSFNG